MISEILNKNNIILDLKFFNKIQLFEYTCSFIEKKYKISKDITYREFKKREDKGSTALGKGVAIPHCKLKNIENPLAILLINKNPIFFPSPDNKNVDLFLFLLMPLNNNKKHLKVLAALSEFFCFDDTRTSLRKSKNPQSIMSLIKNWETNVLN